VANTAGVTLESDIGSLAKGDPKLQPEKSRSWASAVAWRWRTAVGSAYTQTHTDTKYEP